VICQKEICGGNRRERLHRVKAIKVWGGNDGGTVRFNDGRGDNGSHRLCNKNNDDETAKQAGQGIHFSSPNFRDRAISSIHCKCRQVASAP